MLRIPRLLTDLLVIIAFITAEVLYAADVGGWGHIGKIPLNYYQISTPNVLRCGALCERQGQCIAASFDKRERMCYLHTSYDVSMETQTGGRFLFKKFEENRESHITNSACETNGQLILPSARNGDDHCCDMPDVDDCTTNPCQNSGTCNDLVNDYSCRCAAGWEGKNCDINIDDCAFNPCQNRGTCQDLVNDYSCRCVAVAGWTGKNCDIIKWELVLYTSNILGAGTDSHVDVRLGNKNVQGEQFIAIDIASVNDRERGSVDKYNFDSSISIPTWLEFQLGGFGHSPDWHLEKFILKNEATGKVYKVYVNSWLAPESVPIVRRFSLQ